MRSNKQATKSTKKEPTDEILISRPSEIQRKLKRVIFSGAKIGIPRDIAKKEAPKFTFRCLRYNLKTNT